MSSALLWSLLTGTPGSGLPEAPPPIEVSDAERDHRVLATLTTHAEQILSELDLSGHVTGRIKSAESTWQKMRRKGVGLDQIADRIAVRVHVDEVDDCYRVLDALHGELAYLPTELDDYIAHPKDNGYRSLHTAVLLPLDDGTTAVGEVQIRTHEMHRAAEAGPAAHWRYKLAS